MWHLSSWAWLISLNMMIFSAIHFSANNIISSSSSSSSSSFWWYWVWTHSLALVRQALYHLSHNPSTVCFSYFSDRVSHFCPSQPGPQSSYLCLSPNWDYKFVPPYPFKFWCLSSLYILHINPLSNK
jgi:hypothetical protein